MEALWDLWDYAIKKCLYLRNIKKGNLQIKTQVNSTWWKVVPFRFGKYVVDKGCSSSQQ
jgi:hypothetical protein